MKYTNHFNLPESLCKAVERDKYVPGDSDAGVTELCKPPQQAVLERRHKDEIVRDVSDQIFALMGKAVHHVLEVADTQMTEERLYCTFENGLKLGGKFDRFVLVNGVLQDYKVTSVWTKIFGSYKDWAKQLNTYAMLLRANGYEVKQIQVCAIYRDWSATMAERTAEYPDQQVEMIDYELWPALGVVDLLQKDIEIFVKCLDGQDTPRQCTSEEMWEQPTKYALMKTGRKSAVKLFDGQHDLLVFAENQGWYTEGAEFTKGHYIEIRPGVRKRCEKYCDAAPWCGQYQEYQMQQQGET